MSLSRGEFHHLLSPEPEFILRRWGAEGTTAADDSLIRNAGLKGGRRHFISPDDCTSSGSPHHHLTLAVSNSGLFYTSRPPPTFRLGFPSAASLYDISHPLLSVLPGYTSSQHRHLKDSSRLGSSAQDFPEIFKPKKGKFSVGEMVQFLPKTLMCINMHGLCVDEFEMMPKRLAFGYTQGFYTRRMQTDRQMKWSQNEEHNDDVAS
nr:uncharacterized protein LOC129152534 [Nothobranchius furzeri]